MGEEHSKFVYTFRLITLKIMKKIKIILLATTAILLAAGINSCKKIQDAKDNITSAQDFSSSETEFSGSFDITDDINQSDGKIKKGGSTILPSGAVFTWVDSVMDGNGISYTLYFGKLGSSAPYGLLCNDGKYRAGKLHVAISGHYLAIGTTGTISSAATDSFFSGDGTNMFMVEGSLAITRTAAEQIDIAVTGGKVTDSDGKTAQFHGNKTIKRTSGSATPGMWGDVYEVTGNGGGVNRQGDNYTWNITKALVKKMEIGCAKTFVIGVIEIQNTTASKSLQIDFDPYNNGACDRVAQATINGKKYIFTVK
jgi:hypothetical protein